MQQSLLAPGVIHRRVPLLRQQLLRHLPDQFIAREARITVVEGQYVLFYLVLGLRPSEYEGQDGVDRQVPGPAWAYESGPSMPEMLSACVNLAGLESAATAARPAANPCSKNRAKTSAAPQILRRG